MKTKFVLIAGLINIGIMSSSFAAQDQTLIQQTRKNQLANEAKEASASLAQSASSSKKAAMPLDHGPRATATPWENQQRALRAQEQPALASPEKGN